MTQLLAELRAAGVRLSVRDGKLRATAPAGVLTPAMRAALAEHRDAILAAPRQAAQRIICGDMRELGRTIADGSVDLIFTDPPYLWQQPVSEAMAIIENYCPPGGLVVDPYTGSGTTAVACHQLGRRFIGFEINPDTAARAQARLASTEACLFDKAADGPAPRDRRPSTEELFDDDAEDGRSRQERPEVPIPV